MTTNELKDNEEIILITNKESPNYNKMAKVIHWFNGGCFAEIIGGGIFDKYYYPRGTFKKTKVEQ